ncbi:MAG: hypothetical protein AB7F96_08635 [Beijerinckiaceae bacterium]
MNTQRALTLFAVFFAIFYTISVEMNWALVTYHPRPGEWGMWAQEARQGPAMYWYGWIATAGVAATATTLLTLPLPKKFAVPVWAGWAVPLACMLAFLYFLRMFFLR